MPKLILILGTLREASFPLFQHSNTSTLTPSFHHCTHPCDLSGLMAVEVTVTDLLHTQRCVLSTRISYYSSISILTHQSTHLISDFSVQPCFLGQLKSVKHQEASHQAQPICDFHNLTSLRSLSWVESVTFEWHRNTLLTASDFCFIMQQTAVRRVWGGKKKTKNSQH